MDIFCCSPLDPSRSLKNTTSQLSVRVLERSRSYLSKIASTYCLSKSLLSWIVVNIKLIINKYLGQLLNIACQEQIKDWLQINILTVWDSKGRVGIHKERVELIIKRPPSEYIPSLTYSRLQLIKFITLIMKKYSYLGNVRKSICSTEMTINKENINRSIKSIRSFSKSVRKLKVDKTYLKDWETLQTIHTPTSKSNRYCFLPRIDHPKRSSKMREKSCKTISTAEEIPLPKFTKILLKRTKKFKTVDLSIDVELDRLKSLTQNCSKLLNDLSNLQQKRIINEYRSAIQSTIQNKVIEI